MADIKDRAREYIAKHSEYSEVFGGTFIAVDTFTAMVEFAEQETKELKAEKDKAWWEGFDTCKAKAGEANVKLSDENNLLKAQIEKMKCCENCMFENIPKVLLPCHICVAKSNWKLKEIKENE